MRNTLAVLASLWVSIASSSGQAPSATDLHSDDGERPNVILILADDLAVGDLSHRNNGLTRTPNLDRLATQSVRFRNAYSGSCVCAPARAALLTGRYPHRTGVVTLNQECYPDLTRLRADETTIANVLSDRGYATGLVGKWHCGMGEKYHPLRRGFDEFAGFIGPNTYRRYRLDVNGMVSEANEGYLTEELTERAVDFVRRHQDHPFFLHLAHYAPHQPLEAPEEVVRFYQEQGFDESTAAIYAMVEVMDRGIGKLLDELKRLKLDSQTLVIFASDNGPDPLTGERYNEGRRGTKYQIYEGGIRIPLFLRWSGKIEPGDRDTPVHFVDLFPTIVEACRLDYETSLPLDGVSLLGLLDDNSVFSQRSLFWQWNRGLPNYTHNAAIRDGGFKLIRPYVTRTANPKDSRQAPQLFDLTKDETEQDDVSAKHPQRVNEMLRQLDQWSRNVERDRVRESNGR
ncbi:arylsulfatase [Rhodopirellula sp. JC740]|uniref:Arylsulfatase n=1 Tax=Rhodopirellula halodulae TaxID=2894198 RepID=A0ABS8NSA3_9BACT|nr:arylsulfatase [Rhodopirellula sp. JC740]MCC9645341.1 arylsulfatase [Rhodopirellula sp. JC740]